MKTIGITFLFVLAVACGGGGGAADVSGVDQSKAITTLEAAEVDSFCDWMIDVNGGEGVVTQCGDGVTVTSPTHAECVADYEQIPAGCSGVTVGEMEACVEALADEPCNFEAPECSEYFACIFG